MLSFNDVLRSGGIEPVDVRLLRHETEAYRGRTPYALWRDDRTLFERYQSTQKSSRRAYFAAPFWASFVVTPVRETLFVGLYKVAFVGAAPSDWQHFFSDGKLGDSHDLYRCERVDGLEYLAGRVVINWAAGTRTWVQHANGRARAIERIDVQFKEPDFPGYLDFERQLSEIEPLFGSWKAVLAAAQGVYVLTCPVSREQYVGSATSAEGGFLARWLQYARDGHGGNVRLKRRERSDYRVGILQVAGSHETPEAIIDMETRWKRKLQSRDMGLNAN